MRLNLLQSVLGNHLQNKKMNNNIHNGRGRTVSVAFMMLAILFVVCLIASNLYETKLFTVLGITLTGGVIIFPVSYIINDCLVEVYGYRKARLVIWMGFFMNFFVVLTAQLVRLLPEASYWDGGEHFDYIFSLAPRVTIASMIAFVSGSTVNAFIMSKMKISSNGRNFSLRAIVSTIGGESVDSLVFFPIAFWGIPAEEMFKLMITQIVLKTLYEVIILPLTNLIVVQLKKYEGDDAMDLNISYNPFKIRDI